MRNSGLIRLVCFAIPLIYFFFSASFLCRRSESQEREMAQAKVKVKETYYISHGAPTLAIDNSLPARGFLKSFRDTVYGGAQRPPPTSILVISGHWETDYPTVNAVSGTCDTIYDFYGFPREMYKLKYPAPGAPQLATRVKELLMASGFERVGVDEKRGLDHGAWVPLMLMFPEADIPVCQLSVQTNRDGTYHYNLGKALAPLKDEGVLIIGSGSATHNLRASRLGDGSVASWALEFDTWLKDALLDGRYEDVNHYEERAPHAKAAHPWPDHFYPLHVAIGAAGKNSKAELIHHSWQLGTLSYASYKFTTTE